MPPMRRLKMGLLIAAATLLFGYGTAYVASDEVRYLSRAGIEETRILGRRTPISRLAKDPTTPATLRKPLPSSLLNHSPSGSLEGPV